MLRISKNTRKQSDVIIDQAARFFGKDGIQLIEKDRGPCCISFEGVGGYVMVSIVDETNLRVVDVETREWEYPAKQFLKTL
ncbi:MAG: hypothetical protein QNI95_07085 [Desulfobacterales bacterium]|nr:hypothetical protein [Desulfobacterales bacterium]